MNRVALFSISVLAGLVALCALLTALMSAASSLANGLAIAEMSTALMTSQCVGAFMILVALAGGILMGAAGLAMRLNRRQSPAGQVRLPEPKPHRQPQLPLLLPPEPTHTQPEENIFENWFS